MSDKIEKYTTIDILPDQDLLDIPEDKVGILYHCPCPDGGFACLAAWKYYYIPKSIKKDNNSGGLVIIPNTTYQSLDISQYPILSNPNAILYLCDYIGGNGLLEKLCSNVKKVTLLDHHKTAFEFIENLQKASKFPKNLEVHLQMDHSGAVITKNFFEKKKKNEPLWKNEEQNEKMNQIFNYIEDNDLWIHKLDHSKDFSCGINAKSITWDILKNPSLPIQLEKLIVEEIIKEGEKKRKNDQNVIEKYIKESYPIKLGGSNHKFGICLATEIDNPELRSELGHQLAKESIKKGFRGMAAIIYAVPNQENFLTMSLRSISQSEDTTEITKAFGGGGHAQASSCKLEKSVIQSWKELNKN